MYICTSINVRIEPPNKNKLISHYINKEKKRKTYTYLYIGRLINFRLKIKNDLNIY